jgi:hypothetical protein
MESQTHSHGVKRRYIQFGTGFQGSTHSSKTDWL